jgi:hypothetical protein
MLWLKDNLALAFILAVAVVYAAIEWCGNLFKAPRANVNNEWNSL